ncbi:MAG: choice-of-anchor L domain-containing protein [Myxococcota bacterium]
MTPARGRTRWACLPFVVVAVACDAPSVGRGVEGAPPPGDAAVPTPAPNACEEGAAAPGCPCDDEGRVVPCLGATAVVDGRTVCGPGEARCRDGRFGTCRLNPSRAGGEASRDGGGPGFSGLSLGAPTDCADACDPFCTTFPDAPSPALDTDTIVATDDGLTLPGEPGLVESPCQGGTSGTCAHSICEVGAALSAGCDATRPGEPSCVAAICGVRPACCTASWSTACTDLLAGTCGVTCFADEAETCFACYEDDFDHDGDGYTGRDGDCLDCDPNVNAGAYDFDNGIDDDCDGFVDNEVTECDDGLPLASSAPGDYARAIELCRSATTGATGADRTWGVLDAALTRASGSGAPHARGHSIQSSFGAANLPQRGARLAALSTGTARTPGQAGYVNPSGQFASFSGGTTSAYPPGFPKNAAGCPSTGTQAFDSVRLGLQIRVPTNARSFSYNFNFFSSEYPEWVCTAFNDHFVALLTGSTATPVNPPANSDNVSFDSNGDPVSVNIAFFVEPSCPTCNSSVLAGTGFDGRCWDETCGGGTDWLFTTAPVVGGEEITLQFITWDQGDAFWDSTVLVDNFRWSAQDTTIKTGVEPPAPPPTLFEEGTFVRDYDGRGLCPDTMMIRWGIWSWQADAPGGSEVVFRVATADTAVGLDAAPVDALTFTAGDVAGAPAVAADAYLGAYDTQSGGLVVDETLVANGRRRDAPFLRVTSQLSPSDDQLFAPTLTAWNLTVTCVDSL